VTRIDKGLSSTPVDAIEQPDAITALGTLWGKTTGIFALASFGILGLGLLNVAILTRFLDPSAYGELGILLFFSGLLTVLYNLGSVQGVFSLVFGSAGEEDMDDSDVGESGNQKRALGTGLFFSAIIALLGTALIAAAAAPIAGYLLGDRGDADLVILAAASGGIASVVRLATNVVRMERRPRAFSILLAARPALALAAAIPLVVAGGGVGGVLLGFVIGNALALVAAMIAAWRSYEFGFDRSLLPEILKTGAVFIPVAAGFWVIQNVDLFLLSRYVPAAEIGYYRVAGRVAGLGYHFSSAFLMAWGPLRLTSTFRAVEEHRGSGTVRGEILAYFIFAGLWLVLGLAVSAHALVRIAPESYASAAPLIPLLGAGAVAHGVMVVTYRSSKFPRRRQRYPVIVVTAAVLFIPLAIWLIVSYGATGAAVSAVIVFLLGTLAVALLSQRGPNPIDFQYRRIAMALLSAGVCMGAAFAGDLAGDPWRYLVDAAAVIGYPG
jgi:O-antigen/teichoic acid export membrane protein